jgi:hypothetical protein
MTEVDEIQGTPLPVHKKAWDQKDLLEGIVQRYLTVRSHVGGLWPTWEVESDQLDEQFNELNTYLERLGWMVRLRRGDTTLLTALPLPHRQFPGSRIHSTCGLHRLSPYFFQQYDGWIQVVQKKDGSHRRFISMQCLGLPSRFCLLSS